MLSAAEVLEAAADLLEKPGAWTQGANARRLDGSRSTSTDDEAVCWCMAGAVFHADPDMTTESNVWNVLMSILPPEPNGLDPVVAFNDATERTQDEVVTKLREAAAKARGETK